MFLRFGGACGGGWRGKSRRWRGVGLIVIAHQPAEMQESAKGAFHHPAFGHLHDHLAVFGQYPRGKVRAVKPPSTHNLSRWGYW